MLAAVREVAPWWDLVETGYNDVPEDGVNVWRSTPDKDHAYLLPKLPPANVQAVIEALMARKPKARP